MSVITGKRKRADAHSKECMICVESKPVYRNFPDFTTCSHEPDVCSSCVAEQTVTILQSSRWQGWSACRCLQCDIFIPTEELQAALPRALVKEMKEMMGRAVDSAQESWRWCLAAGCGHGSLHDSKKEMIRCKKCDYKMCFKHQVPWHVGYTCQEYDMSHPQAAITKTSEELISKMSKPCPGCGIAVQKAGGCNFMACNRCGTTWHWDTGKASRPAPIVPVARPPAEAFRPPPAFMLPQFPLPNLHQIHPPPIGPTGGMSQDAMRFLAGREADSGPWIIRGNNIMF